MLEIQSKQCRKCLSVKSLDDFHRHSAKKDGRMTECKTCHSMRKAAYYQKFRDRMKAECRARYHKNRPILRVQTKFRLDGETKQEADRRRLLINKIAALNAYGGSFCVCCGETHIEFLTIDHVHSNGAQERPEVGSGSRFYRWLKRNHYPQRGYQVLCYNCNMAKYHYKGCPHVRETKNLLTVVAA